MKNALFCGALCLATPTFLLQTAHAEGGDKEWSGAFGVNRVIRTNPGYVGVKGTYDLDFKLPKASHGEYEDQAQKNKVIKGPVGTFMRGVLDDEIGITDAPSVYFGGNLKSIKETIESEVDGGVQLEHVTIRAKDGPVAPPGWYIFFFIANAHSEKHTKGDIHRHVNANSANRLEISPRVWGPDEQPFGVPFRAPLTALTNQQTHLEINDKGQVKFKFQPLDGEIWITFPRPTEINDIIPEFWIVSATTPIAPRKIDKSLSE